MRQTKLSAEDQARVDSVIHSGVNDVERKPFRPWLLLGIIVLMMLLLSAVSYFIAWQAGVI